MQRQRDFFAGVQGVVHQHRVAHVDQQRGFAHGGIFDPMHGKIFRRDAQRLARFAPFQGVQQRLADIDVQRIAVLVFFGFFHAVALGAAQWMSRGCPSGLC